MLNRIIDDSIATLEQVRDLAPQLDAAADHLGDALLGGHKLLTCGNGGSAADAAHLTTEFVCRFVHDRPAYPAIAMTTHGGDLTAISNDYGYDRVFARQVEAFGQPGDVLLAISTSGHSPSVRLAIEQANQQNLTTLALLGRDGGPTAGLATVELIVPGQNTARIQEAHKLLIHALCELLEPRLADPAGPAG